MVGDPWAIPTILTGGSECSVVLEDRAEGWSVANVFKLRISYLLLTAIFSSGLRSPSPSGAHGRIEDDTACTRSVQSQK